MLKSRQAGFVHSRFMDLAFLFALLMFGLLLLQILSPIFSGDFTLGYFMIWVLAGGITYWSTHSQRLALRIPTGLIVALGMAAVLMPLSWWSDSKLAAAAEAGVLVVAAPWLGALWSKRVEDRLKDGTPWYLDQRINLIDDLGRWIFACIVAWFLVGLLPLLLVLVMPPEYIVWGALAWALLCTVWYCYKYRPRQVRFMKIPLGLWAWAIAAIVLRLFQRQLGAPLETGSLGQLAYQAYLPSVCALFVEMVVVGSLRSDRSVTHTGT